MDRCPPRRPTTHRRPARACSRWPSSLVACSGVTEPQTTRQLAPPTPPDLRRFTCRIVPGLYHHSGPGQFGPGVAELLRHRRNRQRRESFHRAHWTRADGLPAHESMLACGRRFICTTYPHLTKPVLRAVDILTPICRAPCHERRYWRDARLWITT